MGDSQLNRTIVNQSLDLSLQKCVFSEKYDDKLVHIYLDERHCRELTGKVIVPLDPPVCPIITNYNLLYPLHPLALDFVTRITDDSYRFWWTKQISGSLWKILFLDR